MGGVGHGLSRVSSIQMLSDRPLLNDVTHDGSTRPNILSTDQGTPTVDVLIIILFSGFVFLFECFLSSEENTNEKKQTVYMEITHGHTV